MRRTLAAVLAVLATFLVGGCSADTVPSTGSGERPAQGDSMHAIDFYLTDGCRNTPKALAAVEGALKEAGIEAEVRRHRVGTRDEAVRYHVIGSPTIQINGVDIDPRARAVTRYGFS